MVLETNGQDQEKADYSIMNSAVSSESMDMPDEVGFVLVYIRLRMFTLE